MPDSWAGEIKDVTLTGENPPFIVRCQLRDPGADWRTSYFSVDEDIDLPISESEVLLRFVLPRVK